MMIGRRAFKETDSIKDRQHRAAADLQYSRLLIIPNLFFDFWKEKYIYYMFMSFYINVYDIMNRVCYV